MRCCRVITRFKHTEHIEIPTMSMRYWMRPWMSQILGIFPLRCVLDVVMTNPCSISALMGTCHLGLSSVQCNSFPSLLSSTPRSSYLVFPSRTIFCKTIPNFAMHATSIAEDICISSSYDTSRNKPLVVICIPCG